MTVVMQTEVIHGSERGKRVVILMRVMFVMVFVVFGYIMDTEVYNVAITHVA